MAAGGNFDGVIVGAGAAGLTAALRAADQGARVALIDIGRGDRSNLSVSGGLVCGAGTRFQAEAGVADSPALWAEDTRRKAGGAVDEVILSAVTTRGADVVHFLADRLGLTLHLATGLGIPGHSAERLHATPAEGGGQLAALLYGIASRTPGITLFADTEATGLLFEAGRVTGVTCGALVLRGRAVLMASGGFASNPAMIARFAPDILGAVNIGHGPNDGRAIQWGEALGAELLAMDSYQGQGHTTIDGLGRLGAGLTPFGAIVVNSLGVRFANDRMGPSEFGAFVLAQPGGRAIEIFDERIHQQAMRLSSYREVVARGVIVTAGSVAELAAAFDLPLDALARTMAGPEAAGLTPPFRGARVTGALAHTQGGLRVDAAARVLRSDGSFIPGLLAAGGAACSISGHGAAGYLPGNGLGQSMSLGFIAGETIAAQAKDPS